MKLRFNAMQVAVFLLVGTAMGVAPAQAGLFDMIAGATKSAPLELKEGADKVETFIKAFSDSGALAREVQRADIAERKIAITSFQVEFAMEQVGQVSDAGGSDAEKIYTLVGVTPERLQSITDASYTAFVTTLTKRGFEVLPQSALETGVFKAELANVNQPPVKKERGGFAKVTTAGGGHRAEADKDNFGFVATAKGTSPDVWNDAFKMPTALKLSDELGVAAMDVRLKLNFARMDDSGTAGKSEQPQNTLGIKNTRIQLYAPGSKWLKYELKKPVVLPGRAADKAVEIASTGGETAVATASAGASVVFGFLKGGLSGAASNLGSAARLAGGSGKYAVTTGADYDVTTGKDLALALEMMVEVLPK